MAMKLTIEQFIEKAKKIHGDKFDYSLVNYKNNRVKIKIICKIHGIFKQVPYSHLNKNGCPKCANNVKFITEEFIEKAKKIHEDKFDYSLVNYKNHNTKVKIICEEHGIFEQLPNNHIHKKYACPKCANNIKFTTEQFIEKAKKIHGDKFDYSLVDYRNTTTKVKIICKTHGIFEQAPEKHLYSRGCPICKKSKGEIKIFNFLNKNNIIFIREKRFNNCKDKQKLPFDFYLPKQNICIEYDGEQHFKAVKYWGGEKALREIQKRDKIKNNYCFNENIKLIRIPYYELKNIDEILKQENVIERSKGLNVL